MPLPVADASASIGAIGAWDARLARAFDLAAARPVARAALEFLARLTAFQQSLAARYADAACGARRYLDWIERHAPAPAPEAARSRGVNAVAADARRFRPTPATDSAAVFIVEALLQVFPPEPCPYCRAAGGVAAARSRTRLAPIARVRGVPHRIAGAAAGMPRVRRDSVSRRCRSFAATTPSRRASTPATPADAYMKTIDLTRDGSACPIADDLATVSLDLWAREHGYHRVRPNLLRL